MSIIFGIFVSNAISEQKAKRYKYIEIYNLTPSEPIACGENCRYFYCLKTISEQKAKRDKRLEKN